MLPRPTIEAKLANEIIVENLSKACSHPLNADGTYHFDDQKTISEAVIRILQENRVQSIILPPGFQFSLEILHTIVDGMQAFNNALGKNTALLSIKQDGSCPNDLLNIFPKRFYQLQNALKKNHLRFLIEQVNQGVEFLNFAYPNYFESNNLLDTNFADDFLRALAENKTLLEVVLPSHCLTRSIFFRLFAHEKLLKIHAEWCNGMPVALSEPTEEHKKCLRKTCFKNQLKKIASFKGRILKIGNNNDGRTQEEIFYLDFLFASFACDEDKNFNDALFAAVKTAVMRGHIEEIHFVNFPIYPADFVLQNTAINNNFFGLLANLLWQFPSLKAIHFPEQQDVARTFPQLHDTINKIERLNLLVSDFKKSLTTELRFFPVVLIDLILSYDLSDKCETINSQLEQSDLDMEPGSLLTLQYRNFCNVQELPTSHTQSQAAVPSSNASSSSSSSSSAAVAPPASSIIPTSVIYPFRLPPLRRQRRGGHHVSRQPHVRRPDKNSYR